MPTGNAPEQKPLTNSEYIEQLERGTEIITDDSTTTQGNQLVVSPVPITRGEQHAVNTSPVVETNEGAVYHAFDSKPPLVRLGQNTSADITPGAFQRADTEEEFDSLLVVPLRVQAVRTKWPAGGFSRDRKPECASVDGITAVREFNDEGRIPLFPGSSCSDCQYYTKSPWLAKGAEYCEPGYIILLMDAETFDVMGMRLTGTNTQIARILGAKKHLRSAVMELKAEKVTSDKGSWYKIRASAQRQLDDDEKELAEGQYDSFSVDIEE